jgi:hypothetical protein
MEDVDELDVDVEMEDELDAEALDRIEEFLIKTEFPFEQVDEGFWLIHDEFDQIDNIVILHSPPVVTFRVKLLEVPDLEDDVRLRLYSKLLELNAESMVAGAYGLEDDSVVIVDTLQAKNIDFNEFRASIDSIALAIREHYHPLKRLIEGEEEVQITGSTTQDLSLDEMLDEQEALDTGEVLDEDVELDDELDLDDEAELESDRSAELES